MSFGATPLGQGRRLDHNTFLGKAPSNGAKPNPQRIPPISYAYGAPALGPRSPPKATSSRERLETDRSNNNNSNLNPEKWAVRDTTVNVASAIFQAAEMNNNNPDSSWASGSRTAANVPRSTSVEYESQTHSSNTRRLGAPPSRLGARAKPLSKNSSSKSIVPDSEAEDSREKSPFSLDQLTNLAQAAIQKTSYFVREREHEPNGNVNGSYDYSAEDREFQEYERNNMSPSSKRINATHRKNRISTDNKAYKPTKEELEASSEDDVSDDGRRRRKKKAGPSGGPLTSLPTVGPEKRRKKTTRKKGGAGGDEEEDEEESDREEATSVPRNSVPAPLRRPQSRQGSQVPADNSLDNSHSLNLDAIPEDPEIGHNDDSYSYDDASLSSMRPHDGLGGKLGSLVFTLFRLFVSGVSSVFHLGGQALGKAVSVFILSPIHLLSNAPLGLLSYFIVAGTIVGAAWMFREPLVGLTPQFSLPSWSSSPQYTPPSIPAENIEQLNARLKVIESALSALVLENEQTRAKTANGEQGRVELVGRMGHLEGMVKQESGRVSKVESVINQKTDRLLGEVQKEMESLKSVVGVLQSRPAPTVEVGVERSGSDEEARAKLAALEERLGSVEGGVKEALDVGKNALTKASESTTSSNWWNKVSTSKKGLTIKSSDGTDITSLITHLVDDSVSLYSKDMLARPDYALHSGGAHIIPHLTSDTYELRPTSFGGQVFGMITGVGYAVGRSPVSVLHPDNSNGLCWPFKGQEGQVGVALAVPTYVEDITIDHVPREVAYDIRTAPRQMEVWGMVEGKENVVKVREWLKAKEARRQEVKERRERGEVVLEDEDEEAPYPSTLPKNPMYIRIASFAYNIYDAKHVQTFPVFPEIRELGVDFGIVVLRVRSNWGMDDYTCVYRMRVHGRRLGEVPEPLAEEMAVVL
ncbi:hypothetical protein BDP27DRAFT_1365321 [Rhodocollybia butyracea]|uniref:SUN domain-containing protein n=1 Tax=Rhodocollybia butyracea TaxID=206335 RepID=A0A9P5PP26_9AGAR|nr:hypothetical protein BDP27DRAFT_1365321 [Rhodocollybia butyracea]